MLPKRLLLWLPVLRWSKKVISECVLFQDIALGTLLPKTGTLVSRFVGDTETVILVEGSYLEVHAE